MIKCLHPKAACLLSFLFFALTTYSQQIPVSGKITNTSDEPVANATITVKGSNTSVITNTDGAFQINVPSDRSTLVVSHVSYETVEITVGRQRQFSLSLTPLVGSLEDVVVVGYGTQKKSDVTGAISKIGEKEMKAMPVQNPLQAMQGKVAGVDITSNERPGEIGSIRIRGERSITATNQPLYVVDGIPLQGTGIENLNPNDIESIEVLKDASATAIYGSRGANGVVLVTTKRGKNGKLSLDYSGTLSFETLHDRTEMMNSEEWLDYSRAAKIRAGTYNGSSVISLVNDQKVFGSDPFAFANIQKGWAGGTWNGSLVPTYDWTESGLQTAKTQIHTISASGGSDKIQAYGSLGYMDQEGTQPGQEYKRYTGKISVDLQPTKFFKLGINANATWGDQDYGYNFRKSATGASNIYFALQGMLPWTVPYNDAGEYIRNPGGDVNIINPIREIEFSVNQRQTLRLLGSIYSEVNIGNIVNALDGLKYRVQFGPDFRSFRNGIADPAQSINGDGNNVAQYNTSQQRSWTLDNLLFYNKVFNKHSIGVTLLQSASKYHEEGSSMRAFVNSAQELWYNLNSQANIQSYGSSLEDRQLASYMARVNYGLSNKYLLTVSGRWDGASMLASGHKWDFFPSGAIAWRMNKEDFLQNVGWLNDLKLRLGVGVTGNSAIDAYGTTGAVSPNFYHFGSTVSSGIVTSDPSAANPVVMANPELGWEKTTQYNLGIDFSLVKGRISGSIDVYKSNTSDLLLLKSLPSLTGYLSTWANIGKTSNKGIDILLNASPVSTRDFSWNTSITFSASKSKITELADGKTQDIANSWFVGKSLRSYYDYVFAGIWKTGEKDNATVYGRNPGEVKVKDLNDDKKIDANNDREIVGKGLPDWSGGFLNTLTYKNWELSAFLYARFGFTMRVGSETLSGRFASRKLDYWIKDVNEDAEYYAPGVGGENGDTYKGAMNYQDGSFIKLRNVSLGYNFTGKQLSHVGIHGLKLYVQCMNPGLIYSKIDYIDPDLGGSTFNRSFVIGVDLGF